MALYDSKGNFQGIQPLKNGGLQNTQGQFQGQIQQPTIKKDILTNITNIGKEISGAFKSRTEAGAENILKAPEQTKFETGLQVLGQGAGFVGDIAGMAISKFGQGLWNSLKDKPKEDIKNIAETVIKTPIAQQALKAAEKGISAYKTFKEDNPRAARDIEAVFNISTLIPIEKGVEIGLKTAKGALPIIARTLSEVETEMNALKKINAIKNTDKTIDYSIQKAIRPSVAGKKTITDISNYNNKAREAVKSIVENKENLALKNTYGIEVKSKLPETLDEFSQAINQTKKNIYNQYNTLQKQAGAKGAQIELTPIAKELDAVVKNPILEDLHPEVIDYARKRSEALIKRGTYTSEQAENAIEVYNQTLQSFYRNPSYENASKVQIDAMIANNLRKALDTEIGNLSGAGYQALKNKYGALKSIEKDVVNRAIIDARKSPYGFFDISNVLTGGEVVSGLLTMNPSLSSRGGSGKSICEDLKFINNPNTIVRKMFNDVARAYGKM